MTRLICDSLIRGQYEASYETSNVLRLVGSARIGPTMLLCYLMMMSGTSTLCNALHCHGPAKALACQLWRQESEGTSLLLAGQ